MKKITVLCFLCILITIQTTFAQDKIPLRLGYVPLLTQAPLIVSYENNYLDFQTVELTLIKYISFTSIEAALRVGAIDAASIPIPIALSIASDAYQCERCRITILGAIHQGGSTLVSRSQEGLDAIRGNIIGLPGLDSSESLLLKKVLTEGGLRFGLEYKALAVPFEMAIKQLTSGKLAALYFPEPYGTIAEKEHSAFAVKDLQSRLQGNLLTVLVVRSDLLTAQPAAIQEWLMSVMNGCHAVERDIEESGGQQTAIIQSTYFGYPQDIIAEALVQRKGSVSFQYVMPEVEELQEYLQWASDMKLIMRSIDWDALIGYDFVNQALER